MPKRRTIKCQCATISTNSSSIDSSRGNREVESVAGGGKAITYRRLGTILTDQLLRVYPLQRLSLSIRISLLLSTFSILVSSGLSCSCQPLRVHTHAERRASVTHAEHRTSMRRRPILSLATVTRPSLKTCSVLLGCCASFSASFM